MSTENSNENMPADVTSNAQNPSNAQGKEVILKVFLDSGVQMFFVPISVSGTCAEPGNEGFTPYPNSLKRAIKDCIDRGKHIEKVEEAKGNDENKGAESNDGNGGKKEDKQKNKWDKHYKEGEDKGWIKFKPYPYLRARIGEKIWYPKGSDKIAIKGIWFMIETNTSAQDSTQQQKRLDRGYFYQEKDLTDDDKKNLIDAKKNGTTYNGKSQYIPYEKGNDIKLNDLCGDFFKEYGLEKIDFKLKFVDFQGEFRDVDVILDMGNTRTAGLIFDHLPGSQVTPLNFKQNFKVLRLKPDPMSGDFDSVDDVDAGIVSSWIVLHQLEHQEYDQKEPALVQEEFKVEFSEVKKSILSSLLGNLLGNKEKEYEVTGKKITRIPQMFSTMSPVILGDRAERIFKELYAEEMVKVGANFQQSSPKRYYWDDSQASVWWHMLLNSWDPKYDASPKKAASLPTLQGEMLRFISPDGKILDIKNEQKPEQQLLACPEEPKYPRQSTLTWFLLHLLERAYAQANASFTSGQDFIPHRLRNVLITYPSGWSQEEIEMYRVRCQEALDIFSHANVYNKEYELKMVPLESTPDEAVAGQLPFIFSEVSRYPGLTASEWISLVGKKRKNADGTAENTEESGKKSVRIMNFDIGGGTTDISLVEYVNDDEVYGSNKITADLLFKDGQQLAGDDLIKRIIEKVILTQLIKVCGDDKTVGDDITVKEKIIERFTVNDVEKEVHNVKRRIIRTCLIPLATKCLEELGNKDIRFSIDFINKNYWDEFKRFVGAKGETLKDVKFNFESSDIEKLMEELFAPLFQYCAMYVAAYDVDMLIFSGKTSELSYVSEMAKRYLPIDDNKIIFSRNFNPGDWYPFVNKCGNIEDAKTVTVVGSALYYAMSNNLIEGWSIETKRKETRYQWGVLSQMEGYQKEIFMDKKDGKREISIQLETTIGRRQNECNTPEPVYKFVAKDREKYKAPNQQFFTVTFERVFNDQSDSLKITKVAPYKSKKELDKEDFELKLHPCKVLPWHEEGIFQISASDDNNDNQQNGK